MSQDPLIEKLSKANGDVKKLCEFFAARKGWEVATDTAESLHGLQAATTAVDERLKALIAKCDAEPSPAFQPVVEVLPVGVLDSTRLIRFATFLRDLDTWFDAQTFPADCPDGTAVLKEMEAHLACMITLIETISPQPNQQTAAGFSSQNDGSAQAGEPDSAPRDSIANVAESAPQQLALDDTEEHPMVQDFQGMNELTTECKELVDGYLAAWNIEYSYYNRKKLLERILRWINSAPEGHVLVIKMKTAEEPFDTYPSYISRDVLAGIEPPQDP